MHALYKFFFAVVFLGLPFSCIQKDKKYSSIEKESPTGDNDEIDKSFVQFKFNPILHYNYKYAITNSSDVEQEINGESKQTSNTSHILFTYSFDKDMKDQLLATITYKQFKLHVKTNEEEKDLDAITAENSLLESDKLIGAFNNAILKATIDSIGTVLSVSGHEQISAKMYQLAAGNQDALQMLNGSMKQYLTETYFKELASQSFKYYTNRPLHVGDTVVKIDTIKAQLPFIIKSIYELVSVRNNIARVDINADVNIANQQIAYEGSYIMASLKGSQTGNIEIDIPSGMFISSSSEFKLKGNLSVKTIEVPVKISMRNRVKLVE